MRKYRFLLGAVLCALCFVSCTDSSKYVNALPDDAAAVVAVNLEQMAAKSGVDEKTAASFAEALKGEIQGADELVDRIAKDPSESGLDLKDKVYLFASPSGSLAGLLARVSDSGKVGRMLELLKQQQVCEEPVESDGCTWTVAGASLVAYTDAAFLIVAEPGRSDARTLQHRVSMLLRQGDGEGFAAGADFGRLKDAAEDVAALLSLDLLPRTYVAPLTMGVSAELNLTNVKCLATLNFEEGKAVLEAEPLIADKLMAEMLEKQRKASGRVKGTYLDLFPANTGVWMTGNMDGGKIFDLLCENPTVRQQFESSMMPVDFKLIFNSIKGDMALAVPNPAESGSFIAYADVTNRDFLQTFEDLKPLLALTGGTMTLKNNGTDEYEFRMTDGSAINLPPGNASFWFGVKDGRFYLTNDRSLVGRRVPGLTLRDCEWGGRVKGKMFYLAVSVKDLAAKTASASGMARVAPVLQLSDYVTVESADGKKVRMEWVMKDRKKNVLRQFTAF